MSNAINNVSLSYFELAVSIAKEKAIQHFGSADPHVVATLAHTYATLAASEATESAQREIREGLNFIIDELQLHSSK